MITIKSVGHQGGIFLTNAHHFLMGAEAAIARVVGNKTVQHVIEDVTTVTLGPAVADVERTVFAIAGQFKALLDDAKAADHISKLTDMGFDLQVITDFQTVVEGLKSVVIPTHTGA